MNWAKVFHADNDATKFGVTVNLTLYVWLLYKVQRFQCSFTYFSAIYLDGIINLYIGKTN